MPSLPLNAEHASLPAAGIVWSATSSGSDGDSLAAVKAIKPGSVAEESDVAVGMLLGEIGGEDMRGVDYCECKHAA